VKKDRSRRQVARSGRSAIIILPLYHALQNGITGFSGIHKDHQLGMTSLIWEYGSNIKRHSSMKLYDFMTISYKRLQDDFGKGGFNRINTDLNLFEVTPNWNYSEGQTKGYKPTSKVLNIKYKCMSECAEVNNIPLIDINGRRILTPPKAILSKDKKGVTIKAWRNLQVSSVVSINRSSLDEFGENLNLSLLNKFKNDKPEVVDNFYSDIDAYRYLDLLSRNNIAIDSIIQCYQESDSGRLYGTGINLQNAPKIIRRAALAGNYNYDIQNCHFSILNQKATGYGLYLGTIEHYLKNKKEVRNSISKDMGLSIKVIKEVLIAMLYGSPLGKYGNSVSNKVGVDKIDEIMADDFFIGMNQDIKRARKTIIDKSSISRGRLSNAMGKKIVVSNTTKPQQLAHLLQGVEALVLKTIVTQYNKNILLLLHDGFVSNEELDIKYMEENIKFETGYNLVLESEVIKSPAKAEISKRLSSHLEKS